MLAHVTAIRDAIEARGFTTYLSDVPPGVTTYKYVLVWLPPAATAGEQALAGSEGDLSVVVGITAVGETPEAVLAVSGTGVVGAFGNNDPTELTVSGRRAWMRLIDVQPIQVDRDVTIPGTNRHPYYGVHLYRLTSIPAA